MLDMVSLRDCREDEFRRFREIAIADYADECVRAGRWAEDGSQEKSEAELEKLLPDGAATEGHRIRTIVSHGVPGAAGGIGEDRHPVGFAWWAPEPGREERAFLFLIYLFEEARGKGLGSEAMEAVERDVADAGFGALALHVFTWNTAAVALYQRRGFETTDLVMVKELS
jgi:ribosomal protein S18 acetylase RimI-like enzyme